MKSMDKFKLGTFILSSVCSDLFTEGPPTPLKDNSTLSSKNSIISFEASKLFEGKQCQELWKRSSVFGQNSTYHGICIQDTFIKIGVNSASSQKMHLPQSCMGRSVGVIDTTNIHPRIGWGKPYLSIACVVSVPTTSKEEAPTWEGQKTNRLLSGCNKKLVACFCSQPAAFPGSTANYSHWQAGQE